MALASSPVKISAEQGKKNYLFPLILVTSLFFLWGLAYGLLDVLNKHFQELLNITKQGQPYCRQHTLALINIVLCAVVVGGKGMLSVYSLMAIFFFESIMFPAIFALGIKNLGHNTKKSASFIIMSIAGGAFMPYLWVCFLKKKPPMPI